MSTRTLKPVRSCLALLILCSCIGCDQATKRIATERLKGAPARSYAADTIRLQYALNPGGFLSVGSTIPGTLRTALFIGLNLCLSFALGIFLLLRPRMPTILFIATVFVLAGGIGNLIDRVWNFGLVIDFLNVGIGPIRTGIFNVADLAVTFGAVAMLVCLELDNKRGTVRATPDSTT